MTKHREQTRSKRLDMKTAVITTYGELRRTTINVKFKKIIDSSVFVMSLTFTQLQNKPLIQP